MADYSTMSDADLLAMVKPQTAAPKADYSKMSNEQLMQAIKPTSVSSTMDVIKSAPRALLSGLGGVLADTGAAESHAMSQPMDVMPTKEQTTAGLEQGVTGPLYKPQTTAGRISTAGIEQLANPISYMGPGSAALKVGGALLSGAGSEAAGEATKGTNYETAARLAGGLAGGIGAAKTLGPGTVKAAIPTVDELKASAAKGYDAARNSGLELHPQGVGQFASQVEQELTGPKYGFTGGPKGTASGTLDLLHELQSAPEGATVSAANLDTLRANIGRLAADTKDFKPTQDAKAAMVLKRNLENYMENIPQDHVVAGDPEKYVSNIRQANGDYAAAMRAGKVGDKIRNAENNAQGGIATSIENQQKGQLRNTFLNNPKQMRGFSDAEKSQIQNVNDGSFVSNTFRQLGRGGTGVVPIGMHLAAGIPTAIATGGVSLLPQAAIAAALYGSKKIGEKMTGTQVRKLDEMLRSRSPEFKSRQANLPPQDTMSNKAAIARALLAGVR